MDENDKMAVATSNEQKFEANKVRVKIPPFWEEKPEIWFFQVEAQFSIANINQEETKFNYLVAQLDPKFIENIWDIIQSDEKNKYSCAKSRLLSTFKESEEKSIKKLLTGISLGDMKPSQLLRKRKSLAGDNITEKVLRTLWLDKLPDSIKNILVVSSENLENLCVMADKIFEINSSPEIYSADADSSAMKNILEKVSLLEKQISELYINRRKSRSEFRNSSQTRNKSRSRSHDILIASTNEMQQENHLKIVFERLNTYGLKINISKSVFGVEEIEFLGYLISNEGSNPLPEKVKAITNYKKPETLHDLRIFLGMINFYRRYLKDAAKNQALLHDYLKGAKKRDKRKIQWTEEAEK
ncbi:transposon Tf2-6 polyprotein [Trichonephila clavata]|uniref:Transposon Tf2-6 polyprotein n=2 Tax=Trichonephila clavata TaxID=2740835 RepID=A0A8X6HVR1_TRICU|nr:transposon Tf2-6 polyprotein [Trichonephila clavata]